MIFKRFTLSLILRITAIIIVAVLITIVIGKAKWIGTIVLLCCLVILVIEDVYFIHGMLRKLQYFFDAIRNEDSSLHFPEGIKDKPFAGFHDSLNRLNDMISEIKIRNERNERFFRELLKSSSTGIIAVDEKGFVEHVNEAALRLTGLMALSHIDMLRHKNKVLTKTLENLKPGQPQTLKILIRNELRQLSVREARFRLGDHAYRIYSLNDIRSEMEEIELESWQKLIRVITHEIMNSIAPITSLSSTLQRFFKAEKMPDGSKFLPPEYISQTIEGLTVIEETGKGLMHFVENYRQLAKVPKPVFKTIGIDDWTNRIELLVRNRIEKGNIRFIQQKKTNKDEFIADENLLNQVVINLVNNAADAVKSSKKKEIVMIVDDLPDCNLIINITDTGKGISTENLEKIFIPFFTTKENGSGIGLSLARQIMRLHKGSINVRSIPGKHTTFILKL